MPHSSESGKKLVDRALLRINTDLDTDFYKHYTVLNIGTGKFEEWYSKSLLNKNKHYWAFADDCDPSDKFDIIFIQDEALSAFQLTNLTKDFLKDAQLVITFSNSPLELEKVASWGFDGNTYVYFVKGDTEASLAWALRPMIGVYAIGKNEMQFLDRMVDSVADADQIVICDTGSTDGTYEKLLEIQEAGDIANMSLGINSAHQEFVVSKISVSPFRFDDARNTALALLRPDLDLCVSIDFDEYLEDGWHDILTQEVLNDLQTRGEVYDRWNHRFCSIWNWREVDQGAAPSKSEHWHERIHVRHGYMWKLPVHEVLVKVDGFESMKWLGGLTMYQKPDLSKPRSSYLKMLEVSVKEDPRRWKSWSFLAGEYVAANRPQDAINAINTARKCEGADLGYLANQLSRIHQQLGNNKEMISEMFTATMIDSHLREYKVYLARMYQSTGDLHRAKMMLKMAKEIIERPMGYQYDPNCWNEEFDNLYNEVVGNE